MFIPPMLLETAQHPFSDPNFIFEPKIDGHRLILSQINGITRLYTRHQTVCTNQYPELLKSQFPHDIILDGEVACADPATGMIDFESVMQRFQLKKHDRIKRASESLPVTYVVFDVIMYKGKDLRSLPLMVRKGILASIELPNKYFSLVPFVEDAGETLFAEMQRMKMEGMVAKRMDSIYESRRSSSWLKVINWSYVDVYITGYRKQEFGWLVAVEDVGKLRPAGIIELGVTPEQRRAFYGVSKQLIRGDNKDSVFIEPLIKATVKMRNWTKSGMLRSPVFVKFML